MVAWLILFCGSIVFLYFYLKRKFSYWKHQNIPGVHGLFGGVKELYGVFKKPLFEAQLENYKKYGRLFGDFEGIRPVLYVGEPELVKRVLVKDFHAFHNRIKLDVGEPVFEEMLQFARDERWKRIRSIMTPTFTSGRMRKMASLLNESLENLVNCCKAMADKDEVINCGKCYRAFSLDVVASTAFGTQLNSLLDTDSEFVKKASTLTGRDQPMSYIVLLLFQFLFRLTGGLFFKRIMEYFSGIASHIIDERKKLNMKRNDFLQLMLEAQEGVLEVTSEDIAEIKEEKAYNVLPKHKTLSRDEMLSQCVLFLLVGNETTSTTVTFVNYLLALNPDCQEKLYEEINEAWKKHGEMNFDVVNKLPYLDAVVCETLRLYPVLFWLTRECTEECTLEGTGITTKKGLQIIIPVYSMHHDPEFYSDPEKFNPDRFLPENKHLVPHYAYLPFGGGPRNCIGMRFALMVIKFAMVHILRELKLVATEETKKPLKFFRGQRFMLTQSVRIKMERRSN